MIADCIQHPAFPLLIGALLIGFLPVRIRRYGFLVFPLIGLFLVIGLPQGHSVSLAFAQQTLMPLKVDALSQVFGFIFALTALIGGIYAYHIEDRIQQAAALLYAGGALGVTFAGDYFTLFIFWELMAVSSTVLIWARRNPAAQGAGIRYLLFHIFGGGLLFAGILLHSMESGSLMIEALPDAYRVSSVLILLGIALNTAIPPLHAWLPDAYAKATVTGAVFLSAFTTKSAVYVLIRVFPGWEILIWVGVAMALYGVVYAVLVNDIREILAYHIISQVGYMVAGVGIGTEMALNGSTVHAFSHILYKSLLFMGAGAVLYATGKSKLTELGGFARKMKVVVFLYMIGAFSISGFPFFNGFISKSMVVSAAGYAHFEWAMLLLILASVGTFLHTGLKLPYFTWFGKARGEIKVKPLPLNIIIAMGIGAFLCTLFGVFPGLIYRYLPHPVHYQPYTVYHFVEMTQILVFTFIGFWILRKPLESGPKIALDTDWFYRKPGNWIAQKLVGAVDVAFGWCENRIENGAQASVRVFTNPSRWLNPFHSQHKSTTYSPPTGTVMVWILLIFVIAGVFMLQ